MILNRTATSVKSFKEGPEHGSSPAYGPAADLAVLIAVTAYLLSYFTPELLLLPVVATGGDMASHYQTAAYLKDVLLPQGRISGWFPGNFAGFPLLQYYFPLPFLAMMVFCAALPLEAAFKAGTALGTFLLPFCAYAFLRLIRRPFPEPAAGAALSLVFLFMGGNSMWGGNVASTMAGEFCYSLGFSLAVLWLGLVWRTVETGRGVVLCALVLALTGLAHAYALLYAASATAVFLLSPKRFSRNVAILIKIHALAFCFMGFWILPLLANLADTTRFNILWLFFSWKQVFDEVFPASIRPFIISGLAFFVLAGGLALGRRRKARKAGKTGCAPAGNAPPAAPFLAFLAFWGLLLYFLGYRARVVDVRFLPFFQFFLILAPVLFFRFLKGPRLAALFALGAVVAGIFLWTDSHEKFVRSWIKGNYQGFQAAPLWPAYSGVNRYLKGDASSPRAAYEHSMIHHRAGTVRAFESMPYFSGRSTLEGVYIQASLTVPFIFYLQSEISEKPSTPIPDYNYSRFNLDRGAEHLRLFNASYLVSAEDRTADALERHPDFTRVDQEGPYGIYKVAGATGRYVEPLVHRPVLLSPENFRVRAYRWFRMGDLSVIPVFADDVPEAVKGYFVTGFSGDPARLPALLSAPADFSALTESVQNERVIIRNAVPGRPLLVKISHHRGWLAKGALGPWLAGPGFMLVIPESKTVELVYGPTAADRWGLVLSILAALVSLLAWRGFLDGLGAAFDRHAWKAALPLIVVILAASVFFLFPLAPEYPAKPFNRAIALFTGGDLEGAKKEFAGVLSRHPQTLISDEAAYHYAMCWYRQEKWAETIKALDKAMAEYPESRRAAEMLYHRGLCLMKLGRATEARTEFIRAMKDFPESVWAGFSRDRLM